MKRRLLLWMTVSCALLAGSQASASYHYVGVGDKFLFSKTLPVPSPSPLGGPYTAYAVPFSAPGTPLFKTFCAEVEEPWAPAVTYVVTGIGTSANTGKGKLSGYTAWLYKNYLDGTLAGYNETLTTDRDALQYAIWNSLGYSHSDIRDNPSPNYDDARVDAALATYLTKSWAASGSAVDPLAFGQVRIANLARLDNGALAQDVLVMVPAPGAAVLACLGLGLVGRLRRRLV